MSGEHYGLFWQCQLETSSYLYLWMLLRNWKIQERPARQRKRFSLFLSFSVCMIADKRWIFFTTRQSVGCWEDSRIRNSVEGESTRINPTLLLWIGTCAVDEQRWWVVVLFIGVSTEDQRMISRPSSCFWERKALRNPSWSVITPRGNDQKKKSGGTEMMELYFSFYHYACNFLVCESLSLRVCTWYVRAKKKFLVLVHPLYVGFVINTYVPYRSWFCPQPIIKIVFKVSKRVESLFFDDVEFETKRIPQSVPLLAQRSENPKSEQARNKSLLRRRVKSTSIEMPTNRAFWFVHLTDADWRPANAPHHQYKNLLKPVPTFHSPERRRQQKHT